MREKRTHGFQKSISYQLETLEDGKRYALKVRNLLPEGDYRGFLLLHTDIPLKSEIRIRVHGTIGEATEAAPRK